jgi:SAM-dependent methyltransferase
VNKVFDIRDLDSLAFKSILREMDEYLGVESTSYLHPGKRWEYPWAVINSGVRAGMKVLDAGCGNSIFPIYLAKSGCEVTAADLEIDTRLAGIHGVPINYHVGTITDLPFDDDSFDMVFCLSVLEHLPEHETAAAVRELVRVLRPGGRFVVTVDYFDDLTQTIHFEMHGRHRIVDWPIFDEEQLYARIIGPSGLPLQGETDFGVDWPAKKQEMRAFHPFEYTSLGCILHKPALERIA